MDLYQTLSEEHERARETIRKILQGPGGKPREALFAQLKRDLDSHTMFEEEAFYPAIAERLGDGGMIDEALAEHDEATALLEELHELDKDSDEFMERLQELEQALEHHIRREEGEIFAAARESLSAERAAELSRRREAERKQAAAVT